MCTYSDLGFDAKHDMLAGVNSHNVNRLAEAINAVGRIGIQAEADGPEQIDPEETPDKYAAAAAS